MTQNFHASGVSGACPDIDTLSDLQAGVLDATTAHELRQHVASCADCTELLAALDATVASLAAMPEVQIPPDVARRIDQAIAAEAGRIGLRDDLAETAPPTNVHQLGTARTAHPVTPRQSEGSNVASLAQHREKRAGRGRLLLGAAAAAAVLGIGTIILTQNNSTDTTANQADKQQSQDAEPTAQAPGNVQSFSSPKDVLDKGAIENDKVSPDVAGKMAELAERNKCLSKIPNRPATAPEAVQAGKQGSKDAYAFVFPTKDPQKIQMIIVDAADCSTVLGTEEGPRE